MKSPQLWESAVEGICLFGLFGETGPVVSLTELLMSAHYNTIDVLVSGYCYTIEILMSATLIYGWQDILTQLKSRHLYNTDVRQTLH